jgi:hypothetical protein
MLLIKKNENNRLVLTLTEKLTEVTNEYHFTFTNDFSGQSLTISLEDNSTYPIRYNEFFINEPIDLEFTIGYHNYSVEDDNGNVLETGKLLVTGTSSTNTYYEPTGTNINNVFYDPTQNN